MAPRLEINDLLENIRAELPTRVHSMFEEAVQRASEGQRQGRKRVEHELRHISPWERQRRHYQEQESVLTVFALLIGFISGVAVMYLFDPERGERRRAQLAGQAQHMIDQAGDGTNRIRGEVDQAAEQAADSLRDMTGQARDQVGKATSGVSSSVRNAAGQASKTAGSGSTSGSTTSSSASESLNAAGSQVRSTTFEARPRAETASLSDVTLLARVRAEVARDVRSPGLVEVEIKDGAVSLTGKIRAGEVQTMVEKIAALPGVRSVDNRLEIHDAIENTSNPSSSGSSTGTP